MAELSDNPTLKAIYTFICDYWEQFGYGPSLREIAKASYISKPNVYRYLDRLEEIGLITRDPGRARSITLVTPCPDEKKIS
jgi:DNA-binding MarR family transcriptional regulator